MSPETLFRIHLVLGYLAWLLCFGVYIWPRLRSMDHVEAQRAIATLHSFRFFGLVFILPGVVGNLPAGFTTFAAYGDSPGPQFFVSADPKDWIHGKSVDGTSLTPPRCLRSGNKTRRCPQPLTLGFAGAPIP